MKHALEQMQYRFAEIFETLSMLGFGVTLLVLGVLLSPGVFFAALFTTPPSNQVGLTLILPEGGRGGGHIDHNFNSCQYFESIEFDIQVNNYTN